jgi:putative ABC transport system permease protein
MAAQDFSNDVYIPLRTLQQRIGDTIMIMRSGSREGEIIELNQITLRCRDVGDVKKTAELVSAALSSHEKMEDISVVVPLELLEQARTTRAMFMLFMGMIAAISLLVGGIGIMNIMLATVTERTREIGIRLAVGARGRDVMRQFLTEAVLLSIMGGALGIATGFWLAPLLTRFFEFPTLISTESVVLAFSVSAIIGVVFGFFPALKAANLDPIDALRYE